MSGWIDALHFCERRRRVRLIPRRARQAFVRDWVMERELNADRPDGLATEEAMASAKRELKNPALWMIIEMILRTWLLPLLKEWWENRHREATA